MSYEKIPSNPPEEVGGFARKQAEYMASLASVDLTPEEIEEYAVLRRDTGREAALLSDQKLLAGILAKRSDPTAVEKFKEFYPTI